MLLFAVSVAIATPCLAKCPHIRYKLEVHALDRATGAPIAQAQVLFFLPGDDSALRKAGSPSSAGLTDKAGSFTGDFLFNTYSGWWLGDRCGAELTELQVIVVPPDRPAERFHLRDLRPIGSPTDEPITLQPITVRLFPAPHVQRGW